MDKVCDYCKEAGEAYTFRRYVDADETICGKCLRVLPTDAVAGRRMVYDLRIALTTTREENQRLTAENANLRAATRGKTFSHSDEEVNAEMGRLRAKVERYEEALKIYADEDQWSSAYMDPWKLRFESRHMDGNGWDTAREALKEPQ